MLTKNKRLVGKVHCYETTPNGLYRQGCTYRIWKDEQGNKYIGKPDYIVSEASYQEFFTRKR